MFKLKRSILEFDRKERPAEVLTRCNGDPSELERYDLLREAYNAHAQRTALRRFLATVEGDVMYKLYKSIAEESIAKGMKRISAPYLCHVTRYKRTLQMRAAGAGEDGKYVVNNNISSPMFYHLVLEHPELLPYAEFRVNKAEGHE